MPLQRKVWEEWRDTVRRYDPTRPWISSDGEDDGDGILPVTVGHYGDTNSMKHWIEIGKPWGIGEHSMAYFKCAHRVPASQQSSTFVLIEEGISSDLYLRLAGEAAKVLHERYF